METRAADRRWSRHELVTGFLLREPVPRLLHPRVQVRLGRLLAEYAERTRLGEALGFSIPVGSLFVP